MATNLPKKIIDALPKQFSYTRQMSLGEPPRPIVPENATPIRSTEMGRNIIGYEIPLEKPADYPETDAKGFPVPPLVAKYDVNGKLLKIESQQRYFADNEYHIQPQYSATGEFITDSASTNAANSGSFFQTIKRDLGPIVLAALAGNAAAGNLSGLLGGGGAGAAAGAGGNAGALINAGMGGSAAQAASAAANLATTSAGLNAAVAAGGGLVPGVTANFLSPGVVSGAGGAAPAANLGLTAGGQDIAQLQQQLANTQMPPVTSGPPIAGEVVPGALPAGAEEVISPEVQQLINQSDALAKANQAAQAAGGFTPAATAGLLSLGEVGTAIMDFAKANPSIAGALIGGVTSAIGASNAPKSTTATTAIDPELKREYLANIERAKEAAAGLGVRQFAEPNQMYTDAEKRLYNLGMTPFGAEDIARFYNPFQEQVVQGALGDIERTRQIQEQANMEQATRARAFGGSRQGVVSGMTNEAALRQAATTGANLRSTGFNTAADLGFRARTTDTSGLRTSMDLGTARTALDQARLDAERNLALERLGITSGSLGIGIPNLGGSTSQPLYSSTAGSALSGGLTGSYIGSLLGGVPTQKPYKPGDFIQGP